MATLVGQRVFGIALGYEDLIDHDQLRHDPVMAVLGGKLAARRADCAPLAGKSTLNRLELSRPEPTRYHKISYDAAAIEALFVDLFLDAHAAPPPQITLDLDATDDPLHGHQEGRFFHGYYDSYCYLPLYVFCGRHLLAAKLRPANIDASAGSVEEMARIVAQHPRALARGAHPAARRFGLCPRGADGVVREQRRRFSVRPGQATRGWSPRSRPNSPRPHEQSQRTGKPARRFKDFTWPTRDSWSRERRVVAKAEWTGGEANPRFVVTSLAREEHEARHLYEKLYCARGEMENRIKECQLDLFADRTSAADDARQPAAAVVRLDGLCADLRLAPHRPGPHPVRPRLLRHDPPQAAEDRGAGAHQRAPHQARHALGLPLSGRVPRRPRRADRRRDGLTNQKAPPTYHPDTTQDHCSLAGLAKVETNHFNPQPPLSSASPRRSAPAARKSTPL